MAIAACPSVTSYSSNGIPLSVSHFFILFNCSISGLTVLNFASMSGFFCTASKTRFTLASSVG